MAASQNEFGTCELSLHEKTNIIQKIGQNHYKLYIITFIIYPRAILKLYHYIELCKNHFVICTPRKIHLHVAAPF